MKKSLKSLMAVGIAGISMFSAFAFGGCSEEKPAENDLGHKIEVDGDVGFWKVDSDLYIIVDGTLHKGDLYAFCSFGRAGFGVSGYDLYCGGDGMEVYTNDVNAYNKNFKPDENQYQEVCEKCFGE